MNNAKYQEITEGYQSRQKKRLLLSAVLTVAGFALAATGIGGIVGFASVVYLMFEGIRTFSLSSMKKKSLKKMEQSGELSEALAALDHAACVTIDGLTYAVADKYLFLPYGAVLPIADIAWIYQHEQTIRFMMIPVIQSRWCNMMLLDGTNTLAFYGKAKDTQALGQLLTSLQAETPQLLLGYSPENQKRYDAMVAARKGKQLSK